MPGRNSQVARIYALLDILEGSPDGYTVAELWEKVKARGHQAEKRTIYRDLEALAQAGFPLFPHGEAETSQRWKLERNTNLNKYFVLNARELFALYLARGALAPLRDTPFYEDLQAVFQKLEEKLGNKHLEYLEDLESELKFEPGPQWGLGLSPEVLETVRAACAEGHVLDCTYNSVNGKKESRRKLGPHYLYYAKGGLYLVAEDLVDSRVKVFALPRMKDAEMSDESYQGEIQTPEDVFQGSLGVFRGEKIEAVSIEFDSSVAQYIKERRWHPSQRVTNLEGGRIRVDLEVSETPELCNWILGFGPNAKVIGPNSVSEKVAALAFSTFQSYQKKVG